jgi:hypothetical protein
MSAQIESNHSIHKNSEEVAPDVLARSTYQQLRDGGLTDTDIIAFAGELLSLVTTEVRSQAAAE